MLTGSSVEAAVLASVSAASSRALPSSPLSRQAERRLCPRQQPGAGGQQPDKADKPCHADNGGNRHGGKRQQQQAHRAHPHAEQPGLALLDREQQRLPVQRKDRCAADQHDRHREPHPAAGHGGQTAHDPILDAGQPFLGVGGQLEQHQQRLGQRVDGDARQHQ